MSEGGIVDAFHGLGRPPTDAGGRTDLSDITSLLAGHGVTQTVLVQPEPDWGLSKVALTAAAADELVGAVVVWADLTKAGLPGLLEMKAAFPKLRGVCHPVHREENRWLLRDDVLKGLRTVDEQGLSLDLLVEPRHLPSVAALAAVLPSLRMVLDHLGSPFVASGIREPWGVYMQNIAPLPNVWGKVSGLIPRDVQPQWRVSHIRGFVEAAVRMFGYERLMFGSGWPLPEAMADYGQVLEAAIASAGPFTRAQRERFLRGSACEFYHLG